MRLFLEVAAIVVAVFLYGLGMFTWGMKAQQREIRDRGLVVINGDAYSCSLLIEEKYEKEDE